MDVVAWQIHSLAPLFSTTQEKNEMPSAWRVTFDSVDPAQVSLEAVHAVVSSWLDGDHHAPSKPHATTPLHRHESGVSLDIGLLDDRLVSRLSDSASIGTSVRFGHQHTAVVNLTLVEAQPWEQLLTDSGCRAWSLKFITPTTFRHHDRYSPWPDPITVVTGLHRRLSVFGPSPPRLPALRRDHVLVSDVDGSSQTVVLQRRLVSGFVGQVDYVLENDAPGGAVIDAALRMSRYCGVGAHTTHGLGVTRVEPLMPRVRQTATESRC